MKPPSSKPSPPPLEPQSLDGTAEAIRLHDDKMRAYRQRLLESYPRPSLEDMHVRDARLLASRNQLLDELPKGGTVCEVGVAQGDFSAQILQRCKPTKLHLIDAWDSVRYSGEREKVQTRFAQLSAEGRVCIHIGRSTDMLAEFRDDYFDWVYIDTVHDYRITAQELQICRHKVKPGGLIAGHDHTPGNVVSAVCYGVIQAVQEFCVRYRWKYRFLTCESHGYASFAIQAIEATASPG